jgi:tetratricopeptide (TPR) repeat protein
MKKYTAILLAACILTLGAWCWIYEAYLEVQDNIAIKAGTGDYSAAQELLRQYRSRGSSYILYNTALLEKLRLRLRYSEGVISFRLGDRAASEASFEDAAQSSEEAIAARSLYNLGVFAIESGEMEIARAHLQKALLISPSDIEARVNLELVIKRLMPLGSELQPPDTKEQSAPSEQWRDFPRIEGDSVSESRRSYL